MNEALPVELLQQIFTLATYIPDELDYEQDHGQLTITGNHLVGYNHIFASQWKESIRTRRSIVCVCRAWYFAGIPLLYSTFLARNIKSVNRFTSTVRRNKEIGRLIKRIIFPELLSFNPGETSWNSSTRLESYWTLAPYIRHSTCTDRSLELFNTLIDAGSSFITGNLRSLTISVAPLSKRDLLNLANNLRKFKKLHSLHIIKYSTFSESADRMFYEALPFASQIEIPSLQHFSMKTSTSEGSRICAFLSKLQLPDLSSIAFTGDALVQLYNGEHVTSVANYIPLSVQYLTLDHTNFIRRTISQPVNLPNLTVLRIHSGKEWFDFSFYKRTLVLTSLQHLFIYDLDRFLTRGRPAHASWTSHGSLNDFLPVIDWAADSNQSPRLKSLVFRCLLKKEGLSSYEVASVRRLDEFDTRLRRRGLFLGIVGKGKGAKVKPFNLTDYTGV